MLQVREVGIATAVNVVSDNATNCQNKRQTLNDKGAQEQAASNRMLNGDAHSQQQPIVSRMNKQPANNSMIGEGNTNIKLNISDSLSPIVGGVNIGITPTASQNSFTTVNRLHGRFYQQ